MKTKILLITTVYLSSLFLPFSAISSDEGVSFKEYLEKANNYIKAYRHFEASDALKEATKLGGAKHPSLHMRLGILYYGLGLISEAIAEGEKAVSLAPSSKWYKYDLAKFYYVDKQFDKAEEQFAALLKLDPGFTLGYYYLAELYFQKTKYDMAWLSLQRAVRLGHQGQHLVGKLSPFSSKPSENFEYASDKNQLFRFIKLSSKDEAEKVLKKIHQGKLFENLELELRKDKTEVADFGVMLLSELKATVSNSLQGIQPYSPPVIIRTGPDYRIMQRIVPFNPAIWREIIHTTDNSTIKRNTGNIIAVTPATVSTNKKVATESSKNQPTTAQATPLLSNRLAAFYTLEGWKEAWESKDIDEYFHSYSKNFIPANGISIQQWRKNRKRSLSKPQYIRVKIEESVVEALSDKELLITFKQTYESDTYLDLVIKTITMDKETEGWKITQEREIQKLYP